MPKRTTLTTQEYLRNALLPAATETYTVIPHGVIIDKTHEILTARGFVVERELYRCNEGASIAQGVYHLKFSEDPDMGLLFAWTNSYDKSVRFKCCIGGYVHVSLATMISASFGSWGRKHTGSADTEANDTILSQIENADDFFKSLVADKEAMMNVSVTEQQRAEFMGRLYFEHEALTAEQMGMIREQFNKPSFVYNGKPDSVWCMYNAIVYSLQKAHPRTWMDQQRAMHWLVCEHFKINMNVLGVIPENKDAVIEQITDPNQLNIIDEIQSIERVDPLTPEGAAVMANANANGDSITTVESMTLEQVKERFPDTSALGVVILETPEEPILPTTEDTFTLDENPRAIPEEKAKEKTEEEPWNLKKGMDEAAFILEAQAKTNASVEGEPIVIGETVKEPEAIEAIDDSSWPCLGCGEMQGGDAIFHDGQLCTKCNDKK